MKMKVVTGKLNFHFWFLKKKSVSGPSHRQPDCLFLHIKTKFLEKGQWNFGNRRIREKEEENFITLLRNLAGSKRCNLWNLKKNKTAKFWWLCPNLFHKFFQLSAHYGMSEWRCWGIWNDHLKWKTNYDSKIKTSPRAAKNDANR
jgi:hypothetical protein